MKKLLFVLFAFAAIGVTAQNGVTNNDRQGKTEEEKKKCRQAITIMNTNVKNKNYSVAYDAYRTLFNEFPVARVDTYTNGIKILREFIAKEKDAKKKEAYINELMAVYDQQIKYLDKLQEVTKTKLSEGQILGRKAVDYIKYVKNASVEEVYGMLAKSVEIEKGMSEYAVTELFMKYSGMMYKKDKNHGEQIIEDYLKASVYIVDVLDKYYANIEKCNERYANTKEPKDSINAITYGKMIDASRVAKSNIDAYFINSGAATCDDLDKIYEKSIEANKNNIEYLNKVISVMSMLKCTEKDAYLIVSEYALEIEPSSKAAKGCGYRYLKRGDVNKAMEFFDMAIEYETSVTNKSELCNMVGTVYLNLGKVSKARQYAQKAIQLNAKYGDPHILLAQCYAALSNWSDDNTLNSCTYYLCVDRLQRAKAVDPTASVKSQADKLIAAYKKHFPTNEELFMKGYKKGQKVTIGGSINESTTIR